MVDLLKELTEAAGVSGNENEVRDIILRLAQPLSDKTYVDRMGNVIAVKKGTGSGKKLMVAAHMDEVGFIISGIGDNGMLKFRPVGGIDQRVLVSKRVLIGPDRIPGVIGVKAIHLQEPQERNTVIKQRQMYIDIGASSKEEASRLVKLGDYAIFDSSFLIFGQDKVKAKALDDRVGCSIILDLLKDRYDFDLYACFTVQEEVGLRGAGVAAYHIEPDMGLVIEGTTAADIPDVPDHLKTTKLGKGPAISFMDYSSVANKDLFKQMVRTAEENKIPYQLKENVSGGNDAGRIQQSRAGVPTIAISVPCRYIHSPSCVMDLNDYKNTLLLAQKFLKGCEVR
jgi:putative aminopeptidase FrvX